MRSLWRSCSLSAVELIFGGNHVLRIEQDQQCGLVHGPDNFEPIVSTIFPTVFTISRSMMGAYGSDIERR